MQLKAAHGRVVDEVRRRELAEEHLWRSQKMEAIGQLTGGLAPDFNNMPASMNMPRCFAVRDAINVLAATAVLDGLTGEERVKLREIADLRPAFGRRAAA